MSGAVLLAAAALALTPAALAAGQAPDPSPAPAPDPYPGATVQQPRVSTPPVVVREVPVVQTRTVVVREVTAPKTKVKVATKPKRHSVAPARVTPTPTPRLRRQLPSLAARVLATVETSRPQPSRLPALVVAALVVLSAGLLLAVRREIRQEATA